MSKKQKYAKTLCLETCTVRIWKETNVESEHKRTFSVSCVEVVEDKMLVEQCTAMYSNKVLGTAVCYESDVGTVGNTGIQWNPPSLLFEY